MIEIEKKFLLTDDQQQRLLEGATKLHDKRVEDSYLDTNDYSLTARDYWFRLRDGAYELKAPLTSSNGEATATNRYHEITDHEQIAATLQLGDASDFQAALDQAAIRPFMTCYTERSSYEKDGFHIDIDAVTYKDSDYKYALAEIELLVADEAEADEAERRIIEFARQFDLTTDQLVLGKVAAFLQAERREHYELLVARGVLK